VTRRLHVHHRSDRVGTLEPWRFVYDEGWVERGWALSVSLPLRAQPYEDLARNWFTNLLPEGRARDRIAQRLRVDPTDDFRLLEKLGGECAGALTLDPGEPPHPVEGSDAYRVLTDADLEDLGVHGAAIVFGEETRLSLAGAQDKVAVREHGSRLLIPLYGGASTHILKLPGADDAALVQNELLLLRLGRAVGLPTVEATPVPLGETWGLLVVRYDRQRPADEEIVVSSEAPQGALQLPIVLRKHQEDFVQATGRSRSQKYDGSGGIGLVDCIDLVRTTSAVPATEIEHLLRWFAFCFVVGNRDNHGKNLSRLYEPSIDRWRLAPFYDLVNTTVYRRLDRKLALFVAGEAQPDRLSRAHWVELAARLKVSPRLVLRILEETRDAVLAHLAGVRDEVADLLGNDQDLVQFVQAINKAARLSRQSLR
jgi:serine/threonine-protein kinase HipA